jgi:hypothetical protein
MWTARARLAVAASRLMSWTILDTGRSSLPHSPWPVGFRAWRNPSSPAFCPPFRMRSPAIKSRQKRQATSPSLDQTPVLPLSGLVAQASRRAASPLQHGLGCVRCASKSSFFPKDPIGVLGEGHFRTPSRPWLSRYFGPCVPPPPSCSLFLLPSCFPPPKFGRATGIYLP